MVLGIGKRHLKVLVLVLGIGKDNFKVLVLLLGIVNGPQKVLVLALGPDFRYWSTLTWIEYTSTHTLEIAVHYRSVSVKFCVYLPTCCNPLWLFLFVL